MNTQTQEALKMAIEALEGVDSELWSSRIKNAVDACKEALAQPAQEPVAWIDEANNTITTVQLMKYGWLGSNDRAIPDAWIKLYPHPAPTIKESLKVYPAQEPVACMFVNYDGECEEIGHLNQHYDGKMPNDFELLYTHPAPSWQGLSDDEIVNIVFERDGLLERILEINNWSGAI